jgi:DNA primase
LSRFDRAFLNQLLTRTSIIDVIGKKIPWDKKKTNQARGDYWACCPFHGEKTPSFHALESKGQFHCFGCGQSGNAIDFLMEIENLSFSEAVENLARYAGIEIPKESHESQVRTDKTTRLMAALAAARAFFEASLQKDEGAIARKYLLSRGIKQQDWAKFGLGFSPNGFSNLKEKLTAQGFKIDELVEAGLLRNPEDKKQPYDLYRNRLMFAIEDGQGKTISFGARTLEKDGMPKYLNGPETPVFSKGHNLYRYNVARARSRDLPLIIAEGYMDVIALETAGFAAIAPLGTALTEDQLKLAWRASSRPILCFDGDEAGMRAATRALDRALPLVSAQKTIGFMTLPDNQDPDDIIKSNGKLAFANLLENANDLAGFIFQNEAALYPNLDKAEDRAKLRTGLKEKIKDIKDEDLKSEIRFEINKLFDDKLGRNKTESKPFTQNPRSPRNPWRKAIDISATNELRDMVQIRQKQAPNNQSPKRELMDIIAAPILMPKLLDVGEEVFARIEFDNLGLDSLRHGILDIFHSQTTLDFSTLKHHLSKEKSDNAQKLLLLLQKQPINPFVRADISVEIVFENWSAAIEKYMSRRALAIDAKMLAQKAGAGEEDAFLRLSQLVSERRRLNSEND